MPRSAAIAIAPGAMRFPRFRPARFEEMRRLR